MATPPPPTPTPQYVPPVSCMYVYDPVTRCESQRPCDSCLAKPGCMVGLIGACQPGSVKPDDRSYYTRAALRNLTLPALKDSANASAIKEKQRWEFPSVTTTYCPADDAVCKQCIQARFWLPAGAENDNRYCVGAGGCVCIYNCEFNKNALETVCPRSPLPTLYTEDDIGPMTAAPPWTMPPLLVTTTPTPSPTLPTPSSVSPSVVVKTASGDTIDVVLIVAICFFGSSCIVWLAYYCWRRQHSARSVPMATLVKVDTPNDDDIAAEPPSLSPTDRNSRNAYLEAR